MVDYLTPFSLLRVYDGIGGLTHPAEVALHLLAPASHARASWTGPHSEMLVPMCWETLSPVCLVTESRVRKKCRREESSAGAEVFSLFSVSGAMGF